MVRFFGLTMAQCLAAGWYTDKVGPRIAFASAALWWSLFTMITPLASGFWSLFGVRFWIFGVGEAPAYPSTTKAASSWVPQTERAFATAVIDSGSRVGTVASLPVVTAIIGASGWQASFVVLGILGFVWAAVWSGHDRQPSTAVPTISSETILLATEGATARPTTLRRQKLNGRIFSATALCAG